MPRKSRRTRLKLKLWILEAEGEGLATVVCLSILAAAVLGLFALNVLR